MKTDYQIKRDERAAKFREEAKKSGYTTQRPQAKSLQPVIEPKQTTAPVGQGKYDYSKSADNMLKGIIQKQAMEKDPSVTTDRFNETYANYKVKIDGFYKNQIAENNLDISERELTKKFTEQQGSFNYLNSLVSEAKKLDINVGDTMSGNDYQNYLAQILKSETPVNEKAVGFLNKAKNAGSMLWHGLVDTSVGISLLAKDTFTGSNSYDKYFYGQDAPSTKGFVSKSYDLLMKQGAIFDVLAAGMNLVPGIGTAAGAGLFSLKGSIKGVSKKALKKQIAKASAGKTISKITEKRLLDIANIDNVADFAKATEKEGELISQIFKRPYQLKSAKATTMNVVGDALDLPFLYAVGEVADTAKGGLKFQFSPGRLAWRVGLPTLSIATPTGVSFITNGVNELSGLTARQLQIGIVKTEREKFTEEHGIDPYETTGFLREAWENKLNYVTRTSGTIANLTGYVPEENNWGAKFGVGFLEGVLNFGGMMGTLGGSSKLVAKQWNNAFGINDGSKGSKIIADIIAGVDVKNSFTTDAKVIKALEQQYSKLKDEHDGIMKVLDEEDKNIFEKGYTQLAENLKVNDTEGFAKVYKQLGDKFAVVEGESKNMLSGLSETNEKITKLSSFLNRQNGEISSLARFGQSMASQFLTKEKASLSIGQTILERTRLSAANEAIKKSAIDIPKRMLEVFSNKASVMEKVNNLLDQGKSISGMIDMRLKNVLTENHFTDEQYKKIRDVIGPQLTAKVLQTGLAFSYFKNKPLMSIVNKVVKDSFGLELSKKLSGDLDAKLTSMDVSKQDVISKELDSLVDSHSATLFNLNDKLGRKVAEEKELLKRNLITLRGQEELYSQWIFQKNKQRSANEVNNLSSGIFDQVDNSKFYEGIRIENINHAKLKASIETDLKETEKVKKDTVENINRERKELKYIKEARERQIERAGQRMYKEPEDNSFQTPETMRGIDEENYVNFNKFNKDSYPNELLENFSDALQNIKNPINFVTLSNNKAMAKKYGIGIFNKSIVALAGAEGLSNREQLTNVVRKLNNNKKLDTEAKKAIIAWHEDTDFTPNNIRKWAKTSKNAEGFTKLLNEKIQEGYFLSPKDSAQTIVKHLGKNIETAYQWYKESEPRNIIHVEINQSSIKNKEGKSEKTYYSKVVDDNFVNYVENKNGQKIDQFSPPAAPELLLRNDGQVGVVKFINTKATEDSATRQFKADEPEFYTKIIEPSLKKLFKKGFISIADTNDAAKNGVYVIKPKKDISKIKYGSDEHKNLQMNYYLKALDINKKDFNALTKTEKALYFENQNKYIHAIFSRNVKYPERNLRLNSSQERGKILSAMKDEELNNKSIFGIAADSKSLADGFAIVSKGFAARYKLSVGNNANDPSIKLFAKQGITNVKPGAIEMNEYHFSDPNFVDAVLNIAEKNKLGKLKLFASQDMGQRLNREKLLNYINESNVIDGIFTETAVKQPFFKNIGDVKGLDSFAGEVKKVSGDTLIIDNKNITLTRISVLPKNGNPVSTGRIPGQAMQFIQAFDPNMNADAKIVQNNFTKLHEKSLDDAVYAIKDILENGNGDLVKYFRDTFGKELPEEFNVITRENSTAFYNMLSNELTKASQGINAKVMNLISNPILNYNKVVDEAKIFAQSKWKKDIGENFVIVEKNAEIEKIRELNNGRVYLHRNPTDGAGTFVLPYVIFREEIGALGKTKMDGLVSTPEAISLRKKSDYDRDPLMLVVDSKFYGSDESNSAMQRLADDYWDLHDKGGFSGNVEAESRQFSFSPEELEKMSDSEILFKIKDNSTKAKANMAAMLDARKIISVLMSIMKTENGVTSPKYVETGWNGIKEINNQVCLYVNRAIDGKAGGTIDKLYSAINKELSEDVKFGKANDDNKQITYDSSGLSDFKYRQDKIIKAIESYKGSEKNPWNKTFKEMGGEVFATSENVRINIGNKNIALFEKNQKNVGKDDLFRKFEYEGKKYSLPMKGMMKNREPPIVAAIRKLFAGGAKNFRGSLFSMTDAKIVALNREKIAASESPNKFLQNKHKIYNDDDVGIDVALQRLSHLVFDKGTTSNHYIFPLAKKTYEMARDGKLNFPEFSQDIIRGTNLDATNSAKASYSYDANKFNKDINLSSTQRFAKFIDDKFELQRKSRSPKTDSKLKDSSRKESLEALGFARGEFRLMSKSDAEQSKNFLLNKYGLAEDLKSFFSDGEMKDFRQRVAYAIDQRRLHPKNYSNERLAKVADATNLDNDGFKKEYSNQINELNKIYNRVSDSKFKLITDAKSIIDNPATASRFITFSELAEHNPALAKANPDFAEFALIGDKLRNQLNTEIRDIKQSVDDTNLDVNTKDLDFTDQELAQSVGKSRRNVEAKLEQLNQKEFMQDVVKTILEKTTDNTAKQERITKMLARNAMSTMEKMLADSQKSVINSSTYDSTIKRVKSEIADEMIRQGQGLTGLDSQKAFFGILNRLYKSINVGMAVGRIISETIQTKGIQVVDALTKGRYRISDKAKFQTMIAGEVKGGIMPEIGTISTKYQDTQRRSTMLNYNKEVAGKLLSGFDDGIKKLTNKVSSVYTKSIGKREQKFYEDDVMTAVWERYNRMKSTGEDASILFRTGLSTRDNIKKQNILSELRRKSEKKTAEVFFGDYGTHPLFVQNMEDIMPFTNFLFTGAKIIQRYPKSILLTSNLLVSLQNQFAEERFAIDDEGNKIVVGKKWGLPLLGWMGFGKIAVDVQRLLQVSPNEMAGNPYPIVSYLTKTNDWRVRKYYQEVSNGTPNAFGWLMADAISPTFRNISDFAHTGDVSELVNGLGYFATGFVLKDRTQSEMITKYFNDDYEELLKYGDSQFSEFANNKKLFGDRKPTKKSVEALMFAEDLGLIGDKQNSYDKTMRILSKANTLNLDEDIQEQDNLALKNGIDLILGKKIYGDNFDKNWLEKVKTLYDSEHYSEFEKIMPEYAEAINNYTENYDFYSELFSATSAAYGKESEYSQEEKLDANLTLTALRYKFKDEPDYISHISNLEQKKQMIKNNELTQILYDADNVPMLTDGYERSLDYKGIYVEAYTKGVAEVEAARQLKMVYYNMAKTAANNKDKQSYWNKFNEQKSIQMNGEAKLYDLISTEKESFISKYGELKNKNQNDSTANLYFLKRENVKNEITNEQRNEATKVWRNEIGEQNNKTTQSKIDTLFKLTDEEKEFYLKIGVNPGPMLYYLQEDLEAGKITAEDVRAVKSGGLGNLNL